MARWAEKWLGAVARRSGRRQQPVMSHFSAAGSFHLWNIRQYLGTLDSYYQGERNH
jgi:hypothetical protein